MTAVRAGVGTSARQDRDGPYAYANFLADDTDDEEVARVRQETVAVRGFLAGFHESKT